MKTERENRVLGYRMDTSKTEYTKIPKTMCTGNLQYYNHV